MTAKWKSQIWTENDAREPFERDEILAVLNNRNLTNIKFTFIQFNTYCAHLEPPPNHTVPTSLHVPAEVGLVTFSISNGILDTYSTMIDPGSCSGRGSTFKDRCDITNLPMPGYDLQYQNLSQIVKNVHEFIQEHSNEGSLNLFCPQEEMDSTVGSLIWLYENGAKDDRELRSGLGEISVKPLELLVFTLGRFAYESRSPLTEFRVDPREEARRLLTELKGAGNAEGLKNMIPPVKHQLDYGRDFSEKFDDLDQQGKFKSTYDVVKYFESFSGAIQLEEPCEFHEEEEVEQKPITINCSKSVVMNYARIIGETFARMFG